MEFEKLAKIIAEVLNVDANENYAGYHLCR